MKYFDTCPCCGWTRDDDDIGQRHAIECPWVDGDFDRLTRRFKSWTEGQWLAAERLQKKKEDAKLPTCRNCSTKPSEFNGYEEKFCKCGMVHCVTKRPDRTNENEVAKRFKKSK